MKILTRVIPLSLILCSALFANSDLPVCGGVNASPGINCRGRDIGLEANQRISIYFHPITLISSIAVEKSPVLLYLAGEIPMSRFNAIVVNPSLWTGGSAGKDINGKDTDYFRIGSGVGFRRYANGEANGLYFQLMSSGHYLEIGKNSGSLIDLLFYIGNSTKYSGISIYSDFGFGYKWGFDNKGSSSFKNIRDIPDAVGWVSYRNGLVIDINIGIGIPLF